HVGLGLQAFVRVQLNHHDAESVAAFARFVNEWEEVVACHALTGDMDYLLQIAVSDLEHFSRFLLDRLLAQAGVADVNSSFVLRTVKAFRGMPLPEPRGVVMLTDALPSLMGSPPLLQRDRTAEPDPPRSCRTQPHAGGRAAPRAGSVGVS